MKRILKNLTFLLLSVCIVASSAFALSPPYIGPRLVALEVNEPQVIPKVIAVMQKNAQIQPYFFELQTDLYAQAIVEMEYFSYDGPSLLVASPIYLGPIGHSPEERDVGALFTLIYDHHNDGDEITPLETSEAFLAFPSADFSFPENGYRRGFDYDWEPGWVSSHALGDRWIYSIGDFNIFSSEYNNWYWFPERGWLFVYEAGLLSPEKEYIFPRNAYYAYDVEEDSWLYFTGYDKGNWCYNFNTESWVALFPEAE